MDFKRVGLVVGLVVVIVIAAVITATRTKSSGTSAGVEKAMSQADAVKVDRIDSKTYEIITEPAGVWKTKYAPDASGYYKNPKTGEYTMADIITCFSCGEKIPAPILPPITGKSMKDRMEGAAAQAQVMRDYRCPKCGKNAYNPQTSSDK